MLAKPRQFDVRGRHRLTAESLPFDANVRLAVECKSLSTEFPIVLSRLPRPISESSHDVIERFWRSEQSDTSVVIERAPTTELRVYSTGDPVGKSLTQIRWDVKRLVASDAETYDKWAQALASAGELIQRALTEPVTKNAPVAFDFVIPILLINDRTLWVETTMKMDLVDNPTSRTRRCFSSIGNTRPKDDTGH